MQVIDAHSKCWHSKRWKDNDDISNVFNRNLIIYKKTFTMPLGSTRIDAKVNDVSISLKGDVTLQGAKTAYTALHFESETGHQTVVHVNHELKFESLSDAHDYIIEKTDGARAVVWEISKKLSFIPA